MLEKTLESPLDSKEIKPVRPKRNQSWIFFGRTDAEAEIPIPWPLDTKNWLIGKHPDAGKDWRPEEKGTIEDEIWVSSGSWWLTGKPGVLQSMGSQRVGHDWVTKLTDHEVACRILVPRPGIEPMPLAVKAKSPNQGTTREFPRKRIDYLHNSLYKTVSNILG